MAFSVTCSNCNRSFVDIDESLIGQQARCKCGMVVELDPVWDFKKDKTSNRRSGKERPVASARPTKPTIAKKRPSTTGPSTAGPIETIRNDVADPRQALPVDRRSLESKKKSPQKPTQPTEASTATMQAQQAREARPKVKTPAAFDYSDLDQILAGGVDHTPLESTRVDSPFEKPALDKPNQKGLVGAILGGLVGLLIAFSLLVTRLTPFDGTPLGWTGHALYGTYTASLGTGEMTPAITNMFIGFGWWLLLLAMLTGVGSVLLLSRVVIRIRSGRKALAWSRGLLATLTVVSLFSLVGLLFVETIHHGNLIHDLDSVSNSAPVEGLLEPDESAETFQDVRQRYSVESTDFMIGVLAFAVLPLISFGGVATSLLFDER